MSIYRILRGGNNSLQIFLGLFKGIGFSYKLVWVNNKSYLFFMAFIKVITGLIPVTLIYLTQKLINEVVGLFSKESSYSSVFFLFSLQIGIILFLIFYNIYQSSMKKSNYCNWKNYQYIYFRKN